MTKRLMHAYSKHHRFNLNSWIKQPARFFIALDPLEAAQTSAKLFHPRSHNDQQGSGDAPNNSFKPKPLRSSKGMAGKACHAFASTTRFGLTHALGLI